MGYKLHRRVMSHYFMIKLQNHIDHQISKGIDLPKLISPCCPHEGGLNVGMQYNVRGLEFYSTSYTIFCGDYVM